MNFDEEFKRAQSEYLDSLTENLEVVERLILKMEGDATGPMPEILRRVHTIKGEAGSFELEAISTICHNFEDYVESIEAGGVSPKVDNLLVYLDLIRKYMNFNRNDEVIDSNELRAELSKLYKSSKSTNESTDVQGASHRVLVVEGSRVFRTQFLKVLKGFNADVSVAKDGYSAMGRLLREKFDSVITSAYTDVLDGVSLLSSLRVINSPNQNIPAVLVTSDRTLALKAKSSSSHFVLKDRQLVPNLTELMKSVVGQAADQPSSKVVPVKHGNAELKKILFIDDSPDIHLLVKMAFKKLPDVEIRYCTKASEALESTSDFRPDLILLDVMMPDINGPDLIPQLQAKYSVGPIPFVYMTGAEKPDEIRSLTNTGPLGIIHKPFSPKKLPSQVRELWALLRASTKKAA